MVSSWACLQQLDRFVYRSILAGLLFHLGYSKLVFLSCINRRLISVIKGERCTLLIMPFCGAGASVFKGWDSLSDSFDVLPVQLPGREKRFLEPAYNDVQQAIEGEIERIVATVDPELPLIIFGHSLGAILAFEFAHALSQRSNIDVHGLCVSGSADPWNQRTERATGLDDDAFVACLAKFSEYNHAALEHPDMRKLLLPMIRADLEMHENYAPLSDSLLTIDILVLRGDKDELVNAVDSERWCKATTGDVHNIELAGGHMYLLDQAESILELISCTFMSSST